MHVRSGLKACAAALLLAAAPLTAQPPPAPLGPEAMLKDDAAQQLTPHIWVIRGYPNAVIVVGAKSTLVIDTGLGTVNGQQVARAATRLGKGRQPLLLVTTHYHPEHAAGEAGFPAGTILYRARAQQAELEADNGRILEVFRRRSPELLAGFSYRKPDRLFDTEERLDLGGVHARLILVGPAHTLGDTVVLVEEDSALVTGDVVQNRTGPNIAAASSTPRDWIRAVEKVQPLRPRLIIPTHSDPGPGVPMMEAEIAFLKALDDRARALKAAGTPVAEAGTTVNAEMRAKYPDWTHRDYAGAVSRVYAAP